MNVDSTAIARPRALAISPTRFRKLALAAAGALWLIVATGAAVRLTASGLGCESWPGCSEGSAFPAKDYHAFVEFGNRVIGIVPIALTALTAGAAWWVRGLPRWAAWLAASVFLGTLAQAPLGFLTIYFHLNPLLVMAHLLLAFLVLGGGVVVALEATGLVRGRTVPLVPGEVRRFGIVLASACLALVVSGTFVTAAGPHPGGSDVDRLGSFDTALAVHVRATALFGCAFLFLLGYLAARRERSPRLFRAALALLVLVLVQMTVGELQYRAELPWWLVLVHVTLAGAVWAGTVALATLFLRPLASFAQGRA